MSHLPTLLLGAAALLVPVPERAEWLAEWRGELAAVPPPRQLAFARGAFADAFWMRRHSRAPAVPLLRSPWQCLAFLALLAAFSLWGAVQLPSAHEILYRPGEPRGDFAYFGAVRADGLAVTIASHRPLDQPRPDAPAELLISEAAWRTHFHSDWNIVGRRLTVAGYPAKVSALIFDHSGCQLGSADAWLLPDGPATLPCQWREAQPTWWAFLLVILATFAVLCAVTRISLGEYPAGRSLRRWVFLAAKIALLLPILLFGTIDVWSFVARGLMPHVMIVSSVLGFRWGFDDQRRRCPVCLRRLSHPTAIGEPSRIFLEWYGTELICTRGHGLLHVPGIRTSYAIQRWTRLDSSWSSLFS